MSSPEEAAYHNIAEECIASLDIFASEKPFNKKEILTSYLQEKTEGSSCRIAEHIKNPERRLARTGVLIPIAAHQEAERILPAMAEYAGQDGANSFSIILLLNYPTGADQAHVDASLAAVQQAKHDYPQLDIRYATAAYDAPVIGKIRKDLWDATAQVALTDGLYDTPTGEFIGINHDIDTESIGRHYIRNIQTHYHELAHTQAIPVPGRRQNTVLPSRYTQVKHRYPFETHPNIARALLWTDLSHRQFFSGGGYEEGMVIPLSLYAEKGGFNPNKITHETEPFTPPDYQGILGTPMETSPRRYISRLGEVGAGDIWTDDSFGATNECRDQTVNFRDITTTELEDYIFATLEDNLDLFTFAGARHARRTLYPQLRAAALTDKDLFEQHNRTFNADITKLAATRLRLAQRALSSVVGSPLLTDLASAPPNPTLINQLESDYRSILKVDIIEAVRSRYLRELSTFGDTQNH